VEYFIRQITFERDRVFLGISVWEKLFLGICASIPGNNYSADYSQQSHHSRLATSQEFVKEAASQKVSVSVIHKKKQIKGKTEKEKGGKK
jgi:hypothetical protein